MKSERLYQMLLRFYPSPYRHEYGDDMAQCFRDQLTAATTTGKFIRLWIRTTMDWARTVPARHWERVQHHNPSATRTILFARYEAASFSDPQITLDHLLLATLRQDRKLASAILGNDGIQAVVQAIESLHPDCRRRNIVSLNRLVPLSPDCQSAVDQARKSASKVNARHLLTAILSQETSTAARLLRQHAVDLSGLTERS